MKNVSRRIVCDEVLDKYSYHGQREKSAFKIFPNIENLIVRTTMVAFNQFNADEKGFKDITEKEVFKHFSTLHLKNSKKRMGEK